MKRLQMSWGGGGGGGGGWGSFHTTGVYFKGSEARTAASRTRTRLPITSTIMRMLASVGITSCINRGS